MDIHARQHLETRMKNFDQTLSQQIVEANIVLRLGIEKTLQLRSITRAI